MKGRVRRTAAVLAATGAVSASSLLIAQPANAINRVNCSDGSSLEFVSNQSTCWSNPGGVSVQLFGVVAYLTGRWAGCFNHQGGTVGFLPATNRSISQTRVDFINISSSGSASTAPCRV
jgi:hypothetical protein